VDTKWDQSCLQQKANLFNHILSHKTGMYGRVHIQSQIKITCTVQNVTLQHFTSLLYTPHTVYGKLCKLTAAITWSLGHTFDR